MDVGKFLDAHREVYPTTDENSFWREILTNPGMFHAYNCYAQLENARKLNNVRVPKQSNKRTVIVESRNIPYIEYLIRKYVYLLFPGESAGNDRPWAHTVVCTDNNIKMMKEICAKIHPHIQIFNLGDKTIDQNSYNELCLDINFWNNIQGEKILVWQSDTEINHGNIKPFLKYDWIGAPWPDGQNDNSVGVGNGGLALRSKSKMIECLEKVPPSKLELNSSTRDYMDGLEYLGKPMKHPPEDVYYSKTMIDYSIGVVAPRHVAELFSNECKHHKHTFGEHQVWKHKYSNLFDRKVFKSYQLYNDQFVTGDATQHAGGWVSVIDHMITTGVIDDTGTRGTVQLLDCVEQHFLWENKGPVVDDWVGIIHITPNTPDYLDIISIDRLLGNNYFRDSLPYCNGIIVLTEYLANYLRERLPEVRIVAIKHPTPIESLKFVYDHDRFTNKESPVVVQVGQQMRKLSTIFQIHTELPKVWLTGMRDYAKMYQQLLKEIKYFKLDIQQFDFDGVEVKYVEDPNEYNDIITNNIIILNMIDASANNAVLELLVRNVPFFINKLPPIVEYLGEDYPMYYNDLKSVETIINNRVELDNLFLKTHRYLQTIDRNPIRLSNFSGQALRFIN